MEQSFGHILMHEETRAFLYWLLEFFAEVGEGECFAYVRENIVKARFTGPTFFNRRFARLYVLSSGESVHAP